MPSPPDIIKELAKDMAEHAKTCWMRPGYHFLPLNGWMNDPNGTVFFNGHYHLFYQKNPWQETWGYMHWGHARSSDLVYWKRLPIAFGPSYDKGEDHCYSGGAVNNDGVLTTVYTSISENRPPEQWAAISRDGVNFEKIPENPIMTMKLHGEDEKRTDNWRDPYLWREPGEETWHCVVGGQLVDEGDARKKNITPTAFHYLSKDLINWKYIGPLIQGLHDEVPENHHNKDWRIPNFECPNFFPLEPSNPDNRTYCFMCAPHDRILYNVGQYIKSDSGYKFTPTRWRVFDMGKPFYATNTWINEGRTVLIGWLRVKG
ncbi:MAG: glycoside hydrolase family 32 protein, partial [Candidatus Hodarchaeota archaeon]